MKRKLPRFNIHSIQSKILFITLAIAVSTTIISLLISYYAEIDTIKSTTESYMTQYISYADHSFNDMMNEVKKSASPYLWRGKLSILFFWTKRRRHLIRNISSAKK